ncbi:MAG: hypothetical protein K2X77_09440 [Candidatus Obscuribacterales bacterium]|jgi:hypothetical protein|nr:hypothetical protein [Candidatus Obscuribacterales bacterium]
MGFLDDVVKGVNSGMKQVGDGLNKIQNKSQEMMQSVSLQNRITSLEAKKSVALTNLGKLIYDKYEKGDEVGDDVIKRKTTEIAEVEKEIELVKEELATIKTNNDPDTPQATKSENMAGYSRTPGFTCPHCEAPANQEKLFCAFCGGELKAPKPSSSGGSSSSSSNGESGENKADGE